MLNIGHRRARLEYARAHVNWTVAPWQNVLFTDDTRFSLFGSDARIRDWRRLGHWYDRNCVAPVRTFNGGSVIVWGGITANRRTDFVVLPPPGMTGAIWERNFATSRATNASLYGNKFHPYAR